MYGNNTMTCKIDLKRFCRPLVNINENYYYNAYIYNEYISSDNSTIIVTERLTYLKAIHLEEAFGDNYPGQQ